MALSEAQQEYNDLRRLGRLDRSDAAELCRMDVNVYAEHCFDVSQQPVHFEWHRQMDHNPHIVFYSPPEHGKTFQLGHIRLSWELGHNPTRRYAHLGSGADIPESSLKQVVHHLVHNARVREVFPQLRVQN